MVDLFPKGLRLVHFPEIKNAEWHLALEDYLLNKAKEDESYLLIYVNDDAVICGKNQSIWAEANLPYCRENAIKVCKRLSGGGTVYHDAGNVNFSFINPKKGSLISKFDKFNEPVISYLNSLGVKAYNNERNDILIDGLKVSGNAQHSCKTHMISHATLLFDANLERVSQALRHPFDAVEAKGIASKRVKVCNIRPHLVRDLNIQSFIQGLIAHIYSFHELPSEKLVLKNEELTEIQELVNNKYSTENWVYGQSPKTSIRVSIQLDAHKTHCRIELVKGLVKSFECDTNIPTSKSFSDIINGKLFSFQTIKNDISQIEDELQKKAFLGILDSLKL